LIRFILVFAMSMPYDFTHDMNEEEEEEEEEAHGKGLC
jgi:hypothetical protein